MNSLKNKNDFISKLNYSVLNQFYQMKKKEITWHRYKLDNAKHFTHDPKTKIDFTTLQQKLEKSAYTDQRENPPSLNSRHSVNHAR